MAGKKHGFFRPHLGRGFPQVSSSTLIEGGNAPIEFTAGQETAFGALTLTGAGGYQVLASKAIAAASITGGDASSHWQISSSGMLTPTAQGNTDDLDEGPYTLTIEIEDSDGNTAEDDVAVTIEANVYSVRLGTEIDAAVTAHAAGSTASSIKLRNVTITDGVNGTGGAGELDTATFLNRDFSTKALTVTSHDTDNPGTIQNFKCRVQGSDSIYFDHLNFTQVGTTFVDSYIHDGGVAANNIRVTNCDFLGRSEDELNGELGGDAPWELYDYFGEIGGTNPADLPMGATLSASTATVFDDNTGARLYMVASIRLEGVVSIQDNDFRECYYDLFNVVAPATEDTDLKTIANNTVGIVFGARWDVGAGPHGDAFQTVSGHVYNTIFDGNVVYMGEYGVDSNGDDLQGQFGSGGITYEKVVVRRSLLALQSLHGISVRNAIDVVLDQCTIIENDPDNPVGQELKPQIRFGEDSSSGAIHVRDCITSHASLSQSGSAEYTNEGNVLGVNGDVSAYYDGPFSPGSRAEAIAAFTPKVGSAIASIGAVTTAGAIRTGNRVPSVCRSPSLAADGTTLTVTSTDAIWDGGSTITQRDLRYSTDESDWTTVTDITSEQDIDDLDPETEYFVQVREVNAVGNGPWSASASETTGTGVATMARGITVIGSGITGNVATVTGAGVNYVVQANNGDVYWVYIDANSDVVYVKSTDGGETFGNPVTVFTGTATALSVWFDRWSGIAAGLIHCAYTESDNDDTLYRSINTESADALGTQTVIFAGTSTANGGCVSICRARGGNLYCATMIDAGAEGDFSRSVDAGANWTDRASPFEAATQDQIILMPGWAADNQDMMAFFWDADADEISRKVYDDSGDSWAETSISGSMVDSAASGTNFPHFAAAVDITNSRNLLTAWSSPDLLNADLRCWHITESAITEVTNVVENSVDDQGWAAIGIDTDTQDWYVFYGGASTGADTFLTSISVNYKKSTDDGATWGSETTVLPRLATMAGLWMTPRFATDKAVMVQTIGPYQSLLYERT